MHHTAIASALVGLAVAIAAPSSAAPSHHPRWAAAANDLGAAPETTLDHMTVWLSPSADRRQAFAQLLADQQRAGSPRYHHWLTPAQIGAQFGASDAELATVTTWLRDHGLSIKHVAASRMFVEIAGTTATAAAAFGVQFHRYRIGTHERMSIDREPALPPLVAAITGLVEAPAHAQAHASFTNGTQRTISATDFNKIYDVAPLAAAGITGGGQTIAIIGRARVYAPDVSEYEQRMGIAFALPTVIVPPTGTDPGAACELPTCVSTIDDQLEATLDVDRAGSVAPSATLDLLISSSAATEDGVTIALEYAIDNYGTAVGASIVTLSFAECESDAGEALTAQTDALFQQAAAQGQTVFVASGDAGAAMCDTQNAQPPAEQSLGVNYLCASGAVTCVGGTELIDNPATTYWNAAGALGYIPEGAWNEPTSSTGYQAASSGGGISTLIAMPPYQAGIVPPDASSATGRLVPDLSFTAALHDGYFACMAAYGATCAMNSGGQYTSMSFGGTSAAAPSMAAIMALVAQQAATQGAPAAQGAINPRLYQLAGTTFHDVTLATSGVAACDPSTPSVCNNSTPSPSAMAGGQAGYSLQPGFDLVTGWGSLDVASFAASFPTTTVAGYGLEVGPSSAVTVTAGASATLSLTATGFLDGVTYTCNGLPSDASCAFATDERGAQTLTIATTTSAGAAAGAATNLRWLLLALGAALAFARLSRARPRRLVAAFATVATLALASCTGYIGGVGEGTTGAATAPDAPSGTTTAITVTAQDAAGHSAGAIVMLTVQ
ncbi:MAG TPA: S53 family peptidase [Kofleriaceae bacterium]|nr:S53 family peptidase [Kofleriaceae bacterium]